MLGNSNKQRFNRTNTSNLLKYLSLLFVLFGILTRLIQYLSNRSLWGDEASVALNIVNRSYVELLAPLDYNQAAPPGFLWLEKTSIQLFGDSEYSLRLFPLVASIVSLILFYKLANRYTCAIAAPMAIALFALGRYTVYYATEVKQYSSDIMVTLLLCLLLIPLCHQLLNPKQSFGLCLVGAIAIWCSHPAVFVLAGIELGYLIIASAKQRRSLILNRLPIYITWLLSFSLLYFLTISGTMNDRVLVSYWESAYPDSLFDIVWLLDTFGRFFYRPLGFLGITDGVAMLAFVVGCVAYYRNSRTILVVLTSPILATVLASYLHKYPFKERLVLFLAPLAILIIAEGIAFLLTQFRGRYRYITSVGFVVFFALLVPPIFSAGQLVIYPRQVEEIRPVIEYIKSHQKPGDGLYVHHKSTSQFMYYAKKYGYLEGDYILGNDELADEDEATQEKGEQYQQEIEQLRDRRRAWFLFKSINSEEKSLLSYLNQVGQQIDFVRQQGALVYLYDLKLPEQKTSATVIYFGNKRI